MMPLRRLKSTDSTLSNASTVDLSCSGTSICGSHRSSGGCSGDPDLEEFAEAFQQELFQQNLVKNRSTRLKTVAKAFSGKDAVTVLQKLLQVKAKKPQVTRQEALLKGKDMMILFGFFKHASGSKPLQDSSTDFYQFDYNLPSQVERTKALHPTHWDKVRLLEQHIECKDRRHMFRIFPNCFVAREAVDVMMDLKLVRSRREGVHLMRKLNEKVFVCEHVCLEHIFKDEYLFFNFISPSERMREPQRRKRPTKHTPKRAKSKRDRNPKKTQAPTDASVRTELGEDQLKKVNERRAIQIKNRLAEYKQLSMMQELDSSSNENLRRQLMEQKVSLLRGTNGALAA